MPKFKLPDDLYSFQNEDFKKMSGGSNWLNFSEMGTGKTPTSLAVVEASGAKIPLIICPNSLRLEWKRQIDDWVQEGITTECTWDKLGPIVYSFVNGKKYRILNYEVFRSEEYRDILKMIPFDFIVFDEIHRVRNPKTKTVKGLWNFLENYKDTKMLGLSGSPLLNNPGELYVPLSIIRHEEYPPILSSWRDFLYKYCLWSDSQYGPYIYASRRLPELRKETEPFTIRRTKKEVLPFLPDKYYRRVLLEMKPDQRKLYKEMETKLQILLDSGEPLHSTNVLSTLTRLRQINLDPKILGVSSSSCKTDFILECLESLDKVVIFSCFERYISELAFILDKLKIPSVSITGLISPTTRSKNVERFQNDPSVRVCLGTIQTAGEGITLTSASNVILADRWWNEPTNAQAVDRLHRIGQKDSVQVIIPLVRNSIDEVVDRILERKEEVINQYYGESQVRRLVFEEQGLIRKYYQ